MIEAGGFEAWAAVCAFAVAALLACERAGWRPGVAVFKSLAAGAFVAAGLSSPGLELDYGRWIAAGLLLSALGDLLLIPRGRDTTFMLGIASFGAAHVAYCGAFLEAGLSVRGLVGTAALVLPLALLARAWLLPHLHKPFTQLVPAYIGIIGLMVVLSASASIEARSPVMAAGALGFAVSDLSVARQRFVKQGFLNAAWGLPLYFASQLVLALSISLVAAAD